MDQGSGPSSGYMLIVGPKLTGYAVDPERLGILRNAIEKCVLGNVELISSVARDTYPLKSHPNSTFDDVGSLEVFSGIERARKASSSQERADCLGGITEQLLIDFCVPRSASFNGRMFLLPPVSGAVVDSSSWFAGLIQGSNKSAILELYTGALFVLLDVSELPRLLEICRSLNLSHVDVPTLGTQDSLRVSSEASRSMLLEFIKFVETLQKVGYAMVIRVSA